MSAIRWEEPRREHGNTARDGSPWWAIADELRANPQRWALVFEGKRGTAAGWQGRMRNGTRKAFEPKGSFEAVTRKDGDVTKLYARYVGVASEVAS